MKKTTAINLSILSLALLTCFLSSCNNSKNGPADATAAAPCNCESNWFPHTQTPAPPEGKGSPFDTSSTTNCIFHQWSWQKFLWLTKPMPNGKALFEDSLILVDNQMTPVQPVSGVALVLGDTSQAGSQGVLRSNAAYSSSNQSHTVYYSIYVSDIMKRMSDSMKVVLLKDTNALKNNNVTFPVGSLEVKASWISIKSLPAGQASNYHTSEAIINGQKDTVALLGMHVVGVVINHPEFIWATFEHKDMAPAYDWTKSTSTQDAPVTSADEKLFFKKGDSATWQNLQWNRTTPPTGSVNIFSGYPFGIPLKNGGDTINTSQQEPLDHDNIVSLNTCVNAGLTDVWKNYFYNGSIWINTDGLTPTVQADTIKVLGNAISHAEPGSIARGSLAAANVTMETYVVSFAAIPMHEMNVTTVVNCLNCHNSGSTIKIGTQSYNGASPLYLSHIFTRYLMKSSGVPVDEIEMVKLRDFINAVSAKTSVQSKMK